MVTIKLKERPVGVVTVSICNMGESHLVIKRSIVGMFTFSGEIHIKGNFDQIVQGVRNWADGELIQNALPSLSKNEREFLITGIVP